MSFLALPTELRLEVYSHLVFDCLTNGESSDLKGLYLSCKKIHFELEDEKISSIRPLLIAKDVWESKSRYRESLEVQIIHDKSGNMQQVQVRIPLAKFFQAPFEGDRVKVAMTDMLEVFGILDMLEPCDYTITMD